MYLAKEREGQYIGGKTDVIVISNKGGFTFLDKEDMQRAEEFARQADSLVHKMYSQILSGNSENLAEGAVDDLSQTYARLISERDDIQFSNLHVLERPIWKPKKLGSPTQGDRKAGPDL